MSGTRFNHYKQFDAQAVSSTTAYHSPVTDINQQHNVGLQITFVGSMVGTLSVECSNDGAAYIALTFSPVLTQPSGSNLSYLIALNQLPFRYIRTSYTNASGSGTLTSELTSKDLG